jgi:tetratricopeptide (TPR) repeat protein
MGIPLAAATLSPEAQMEAATYREAVLGDLKGAIEQYRTVLGQERNVQGSKPRAITARALFKMGECYEKLGRRAEAQALYTRLIAEFSDQTEFSAQARVRLAAWADTLPSPPQLNFALGGPGDVPAGWFMPVLPKDSGCPAGLSCTVVSPAISYRASAPLPIGPRPSGYVRVYAWKAIPLNCGSVSIARRARENGFLTGLLRREIGRSPAYRSTSMTTQHF